MGTKTLPEIVTQLYSLLEPLESEERQKVIGSVMTLLGESATVSSKSNPPDEPGGDGGSPFGVKATRWMSQNNISTSAIEEIFHYEGGEVELIAHDIPGSGKRGKTHNCYLLAGIKSFLENDDPKFTDSQAIEFCKSMGCHDSANHAKTRRELGNIVAGSEKGGFTLPAPGLRAAAALIKEMSASG